MDHMSTNLAIIFDFDGTMVNLFACYNLTRTTKSESVAIPLKCPKTGKKPYKNAGF